MDAFRRKWFLRVFRRSQLSRLAQWWMFCPQDWKFCPQDWKFCPQDWKFCPQDWKFTHRAESFWIFKCFKFFDALIFNLSCDCLFCYLCIDERINFVRVAVCSSSVWWWVCEADQWADEWLPEDSLFYFTDVFVAASSGSIRIWFSLKIKASRLINHLFLHNFHSMRSYLMFLILSDFFKTLHDY